MSSGSLTPCFCSKSSTFALSLWNAALIFTPMFLADVRSDFASSHFLSPNRATPRLKYVLASSGLSLITSV